MIWCIFVAPGDNITDIHSLSMYLKEQEEKEYKAALSKLPPFHYQFTARSDKAALSKLLPFHYQFTARSDKAALSKLPPFHYQFTARSDKAALS